jgi:pimeloyl-ACP methyl ester carboxylesterase
MDRCRRIAIVLVAGAALTLALAGPASARENRITVNTPAGPGPAQYNKVFVDQYGPKDGKRVLVLIPGTFGGSGDFTLDARELVKRIPGLQVWAIDRRSAVLEDTTVDQQTLKGQKSLQEMFDYYLGWLDGATPPTHYTFLQSSNFPFAREWGMATALNDARAVVQRARNKGKRSVVLGGHSLGASLAFAYAAWDFNGKAGYKDIDGIVAIDGGLLGSFNSIDTLAEAQTAITNLSNGNPFGDLIGFGIPELAGLFGETAGIYAKLAPTASATTLQGFNLLPPQFNPPFPVTTRGLLGYAFDRDTSPANLSLIHVNGGALAPSGNPRDWVDGGVTSISRVADTFGQEPANSIEWFFPRRLTIDTDAASPMTANEPADYLGLRLFHTKGIDIPLYSIQSILSHGRVLQGATNLVAASRIKKKQSTIVNADPINSHLDPLTADPATNLFLPSVTKFLRKKVGWKGLKRKAGGKKKQRAK